MVGIPDAEDKTVKRVFSLLLTLSLLPLATLGQGKTPSDDAAKNVQTAQSTGASPRTQVTLAPLEIPEGTPIEIEAPFTYSSMDFKPNDKISFRVVDAVKVNGLTVIEQGATATGRIERAKRGGHWGKAGLLLWTMQTVTAVDGSQVPLRATSTRLRGDSKGAKVATAMIITGALMPLIAPVALLHGFKRGENAYIPAGKRYTLYVAGSATEARPTAANK